MKISYLIAKIIKKSYLPAIKNSNIDKTSKICSASQLRNVDINKYSYVGPACSITDTEIGSFCSIAANSSIGGGSHPINWVSSSPVFTNGKNIMGENFSSHNFNPYKKTIIKNDVWIGTNCLIKSGVIIGNGSVIGMGSVVTKDIGDYEIWAGNPARFIRKRFTNEIIEQLLKSEWWLWSNEELRRKSINFNNIEKFITEIEE